jgi:hypothetical protein
MADGGQEAGLRLIGEFRPFARRDERGFSLLAGGDFAGDGVMRNGAGILLAHRKLDP